MFFFIVRQMRFHLGNELPRIPACYPKPQIFISKKAAYAAFFMSRISHTVLGNFLHIYYEDFFERRMGKAQIKHEEKTD